jgi:HEAT repeat protein
LSSSLEAVLLNPEVTLPERVAAAQQLPSAKKAEARRALARLFESQQELAGLIDTGRVLVQWSGKLAVPALVEALRAGEPQHREAAAIALGEIYRRDRSAAQALLACLLNREEPAAIRAACAEALAHTGSKDCIASLLSVLHDPDVSIRFWAIFALGNCGRGSREAVTALESMLDDAEEEPGFWSVGKEALGMLGTMRSAPALLIPTAHGQRSIRRAGDTLQRSRYALPTLNYKKPRRGRDLAGGPLLASIPRARANPPAETARIS